MLSPARESGGFAGPFSPQQVAVPLGMIPQVVYPPAFTAGTPTGAEDPNAPAGTVPEASEVSTIRAVAAKTPDRRHARELNFIVPAFSQSAVSKCRKDRPHLPGWNLLSQAGGFRTLGGAVHSLPGRTEDRPHQSDRFASQLARLTAASQ